MNVYILGNGFDLAHGLNTSFTSFRKYLEKKDSILLTLFDGKDYWTNFEENVCNLNQEGYRVITDAYGRDIPNLVQSLFDDIKNELIEFLYNNNFKCEKKFSFNNDDYFLNFNYTPTLEETYDIDRIYHIHGNLGMKKVFGLDEPIILGHDYNNFSYNPNLVGGRYENEYRQFIKYTEKPIQEIIKSKEYQTFLNMCKKAKKIIVLGLGYGSVDMHYLENIIEHSDKNTMFEFYYHTSDDLGKLNNFLRSVQNTTIQYNIKEI